MKKLSKKEWVAVVIGLVVVGAAFGFGPGYFFFSQYQAMTFGNPTNNDITQTSNMNTNQGSEQVLGSESTKLGIEDVVVGTGVEAVAGSTVTVHYVGMFANGTKFDSSIDRGQPFEFTLGQNSVIQGWEQGILGMKVGGTRRLVIPSDLAYGPKDYGPIPGGSTLYFEVQLLGVK